MHLNKKLYRLAKNLRRKYSSMYEVAGALGTNMKTVRNWQTSKKITLTPEMVEGLKEHGYKIDLVKIKEKQPLDKDY